MSMYIGVSGLKAATVDLNTTSQNIANASTTGFKNSRAEFGDLVDSNASKNAGIGVQTQAVNQMFQQGAVITTVMLSIWPLLVMDFFKFRKETPGKYPIPAQAASTSITKDILLITSANDCKMAALTLAEPLCNSLAHYP